MIGTKRRAWQSINAAGRKASSTAVFVAGRWAPGSRASAGLAWHRLVKAGTSPSAQGWSIPGQAGADQRSRKDLQGERTGPDAFQESVGVWQSGAQAGLQQIKQPSITNLLQQNCKQRKSPDCCFVWFGSTVAKPACWIYWLLSSSFSLIFPTLGFFYTWKL